MRGDPLLDAEEEGESDIELDDADAERCGDAEDASDEGEHVDDVAEHTVDARTEERTERRTDGEAVALAVGEIAEGDADNAVEAPPGDPVVEECPGHGAPGGFDGLSPPGRGRDVLGDRFGDRVEHDARADARGEEHRRPGEGREVGSRVVRAEADVAEPRDGEDAEEDEGCGREEDVEPAEPASGPGDGCIEGALDGIGIEDRGEGDADDDECGQGEDRPVEPGFDRFRQRSGQTGVVVAAPGFRVDQRSRGCAPRGRRLRCGRIHGRSSGRGWDSAPALVDEGGAVSNLSRTLRARKRSRQPPQQRAPWEQCPDAR